jgi:hypothetical protein
MSVTTHSRRLAAVAAVGACAAVGVVLVADAGGAQQPGATYTITYDTARVANMLDVAPKGLPRGRVSLGDQVVLSGRIRRDGAVSGTIELVWTVGNARPVRIERASGMLSGVYHLADGDMYVQASGTFDDADEDHGAVVGGTGAYAGARGTLDSTKSQDVVHLLP